MIPDIWNKIALKASNCVGEAIKIEADLPEDDYCKGYLMSCPGAKASRSYRQNNDTVCNLQAMC